MYFFNLFPHIVASPPTNLMVVQEGATSFKLTWTPPSPLGDTTGYMVSYLATGGSSGSVNVTGGSTDSLTLNGLDSREAYNIFLIATSKHIPSEAITAQVIPGEAETSINFLQSLSLFQSQLQDRCW